MGTWIQPLINSAGVGSSVLAARDRNGVLEFFVQTLPETGLAAGAALAPSYLRYPGSNGAVPDWLAPHMDNIWSQTTESDEGGRFYQDVSDCRIVRCDGMTTEPPEHTGVWLNLAEIKQCLQTSNLCTIQFRCIVSQLLAVA